MFIATTRFNNKTWGENKEWREKHKWNGCIYGTPLKISPKIPKDQKLLVIEMNNSKPEKIMGIGLILNHHRYDFRARIYNDPYYNRYFYRSYHRKDHSEIKNKKMLRFLEEILFRGKTHFKRARGITIIPIQWRDKKLFLPKKLIRRLVKKDIHNGMKDIEIIKKFRIIQLQLAHFCNHLFV